MTLARAIIRAAGDVVIGKWKTARRRPRSHTEIIGQVASTPIVFDPRFEIMRGKGPWPREGLNPYEVGPVEPFGEQRRP